MNYCAKILYTLIILLSVLKGGAQPLKLVVIPTDTVISAYQQQRVYFSIFEVKRQLQKEINQWQKKNFLEANFDSVSYDSLQATAYLHLGKSYAIVNTQSNKKNNKNTPQFYADWIRKIDATISSLEQTGYPFASVTVTKGSLSKNQLDITLHTDSGTYITYDSLVIVGNSVQDKLFLMRYLNIKPNTAYNEATIAQLDRHLQQLPFLKIVHPSSVYFYQDKAQVMVNIDDKPSNYFEGIIGIRSDEQHPKQYKVTGDVNLSLTNVLATAASLKLQWRSFGVQNSDIAVQAYYPYLLGAPVALSNEFSLFRQDSSFQRLKNNFGFSYLFSGLNAVQFYYSYEASTAALSPALKTQALENNSLPSVNDYLNKNYGIKTSFRNLDNIFNPTQGMNLVVDAGAGTHKILQNSVLKDAKSSSGKTYSVYDSLSRQKTTFQFLLMQDFYFPFTRHHVLNLFTQNATMYHAAIFYNEQYQLGGLKTFRGVNELAIKATSYALIRAEYRYILPQTGYFNLFCNNIWYESNIINSYQHKSIFGFGAGMGIQTKGGILTMVYALANENGYVLKFGKVHLGFTAVF